jgi:hypothetical protein
MPTPGCEYCESCARSIGGQDGMRVTKGREATDELGSLVPHPIVDGDWQEVKRHLPVDLEESAREAGALRRRREVRRAEDLLRMALAYALCDWSLRLAAAWACLKGWADLSDTALTRRLRGARLWLGVLVAAWVVRTRAELAGCPVRLRLVDATTVSRPGSKGTDWRVHASLDLGRGCFDGLEITDGKGGESLVRYPASPGDVLVADSGHSHRRGIGRALACGGKLVVRIVIGNVPVVDENGRGVDILEWVRGAKAVGPVERLVTVATDDGTFRVRLLAMPLSEQAAEAARRKIRRRAQRNGRTPSQCGLEAAGFIVLLTNLEGQIWTCEQVFAMYRLRWQVEMAFKRLKGVLNLDHLRAQDPDLAQAYLLCKLLGALLAERMSQAGPVVSLEWLASAERPVSPWRWLVLWSDAVRRAVQGTLRLEELIGALPRLQRYLCDAPRRRRQQYALGRRMMQVLTEAVGTIQFGHAATMVLQP